MKQSIYQGLTTVLKSSKHTSLISQLGMSPVPWERLSTLHLIINGLCPPLKTFLSLLLPVQGWRLNGPFHFELSVCWTPVQAGAASANTTFLRLCEFFMNLISLEKKKASPINFFEIVYFLPLAEKHHHKGRCLFSSFKACPKSFWCVLKELLATSLIWTLLWDYNLLTMSWIW